MAVALSSDINTHLQQAPRNTEDSPWNNIKETSLLYRQVIYTAYQYPFALALSDCLPQPEWTAALIKAISILEGYANDLTEVDPQAGYRLCGLDEDGKLWTRPCPMTEILIVSRSIARYQQLKDLTDRKQQLEQYIRQVLEDLVHLRLKLED